MKIQRYKRFLIRNDYHFDEFNYPQLQENIESIKESISHLPADFRNEMILSFVKNQSIKEEWKKTNPTLAEKISSGSLPTECLQDLFDACSDNEMFRRELESYISKMLD